MNTLAFIWDMDGTLVDSYPAIVPAVQELLSGIGVEYKREALYAEVIRTSVAELLQRIAEERGLDPAAFKADFNRLNDSRISDIRATRHCVETLEALQKAGHRHFVFTHRGESCAAILEQTGLTPYFTEVVTALDGFPRKPEPAGILYLLAKYALDPACCFYVGDRRLDVEAAENAGIGSILYLDPSGPGRAAGRETMVVRDLLEIPALAEQWSCSDKPSAAEQKNK